MLIVLCTVNQKTPIPVYLAKSEQIVHPNMYVPERTPSLMCRDSSRILCHCASAGCCVFFYPTL